MKKKFIKIYDKITNRLRRNIVHDISTIMSEKDNEMIKDLSFRLDLLIKESNFPKYDSLSLYSENPDQKPKILLVGYYGGGSLGDDLMLESLISEIDQEKFDITIMLSPNEKTDITKFKNVNIVYVPIKIYEIHTFANYYDAIICGGGAVLDDLYYLLENYHMTFTTAIINLLYQFKQNGKVVIVYGVSSNKKLNHPDYIKKLNYVALNADYFSLRDTYSVESLKNAGIDTTKVNITDDLVFSSKNMDKKLKPNKNKAVKISLSFNIQEDNKHLNLQVVKKLIEYLDKNNFKNAEVNLFPYFTNKGWDLKYLEEIKREVNDDRISIAKEVNNFDELLLMGENYDYFITGRYHMALIFNSFGKKVMLLNYDSHRHYYNKNKYLYEHYKFEKNILNLSNLKDIEDNFKILFNKKQQTVISSTILKNAKSNLKKALEELNKLI